MHDSYDIRVSNKKYLYARDINGFHAFLHVVFPRRMIWYLGGHFLGDVFFPPHLGYLGNSKTQIKELLTFMYSTTFAQTFFFRKQRCAAFRFACFSILLSFVFFEIPGLNLLFLEIWSLNHSIPQNGEKRHKKRQRILRNVWAQTFSEAFSFGLPRVFGFLDSDAFIGSTKLAIFTLRNRKTKKTKTALLVGLVAQIQTYSIDTCFELFLLCLLLVPQILWLQRVTLPCKCTISGKFGSTCSFPFFCQPFATHRHYPPPLRFGGRSLSGERRGCISASIMPV